MPSSRGIFPIQGLNPSLSPCRQILDHLSHQGRTFPLSLTREGEWPLLRPQFRIQALDSAAQRSRLHKPLCGGAELNRPAVESRNWKSERHMTEIHSTRTQLVLDTQHAVLLLI